MMPVRLEPYRWRLSGSFVAHLFKAATQQHHRGLSPAIARLVPKDAVVLDIGAHAGQFTKLFARTAPAGRVYAFEPGSYARSILRTVVWLRRLGNVEIVPLALGSAAGLARLQVPVKHSGSYGFGLSHLGAPADRWPVVAQELVALATLDAVVTALGLVRVDLIKADIEGWEVALLRGAEHTLRRFRPRLLIELSAPHLARAGDRLEDAFALMKGFGYAAFELPTSGEFIAVAVPHDGDFWFIPAGAAPDPL
jgi:FkbM family methyltransferase